VAELELRLTWHGNPTTKKNRNQICWRRNPNRGLRTKSPGFSPFVLPNAVYLKALKAALIQLRQQMKDLEPIPRRVPVNVEAHYYLGARQAPDRDGLDNACGDILEAAEVIPNDYWIASWDGSKRHRDTKNPRTEVIISVAPANIFP